MRKVTALVVLATTGCQSWRVQTDVAPSVVKESHAKRMRVMLKSGEWVEITDAHVEGDSLVGLVRQSRFAVGIDDVDRIATQHLSVVKSALAVVGIVLAVSVIAGANATSSSSGNNST